MEKFKIIRKEKFKEINQLVEIYENGEYICRLLVSIGLTDKEIVLEYFNNLAIDKLVE